MCNRTLPPTKENWGEGGATRRLTLHPEFPTHAVLDFFNKINWRDFIILCISWINCGVIMYLYKPRGAGSAGNRRGFYLKSILLVRGFIENTCSGDGEFDQFFSAERLRESSYIATSFLNPLRHPELTFSQQHVHVPSKDIAFFPNLPAQQKFAWRKIFWGTDPLGAPVNSS